VTGRAAPVDRAREALAELALAGFEGSLARFLSQGQKRRVALARLFLAEEAILWILDEPFTALDVRGVGVLSDLIGRHTARGGIVVLTTHQDVPLPGHVARLDLQVLESA
jgi:heme exporter protein A